MNLNAQELLDLMEDVLSEEDDEEEYDDEECDDDEDEEEEDDEETSEGMVKARKAIRGGKMVLIKAHKARKMTPKQKMALAKARKSAFKGGAKMKRAKSMAKSRKMGL